MTAEPAAAQAGAATKYARDTAVEPLGDGRYRARVSPDWSAPNGPNGGYLGAIVVRAIDAEIADAARPVRAITFHYLRPPQHDADALVVVDIVRSGRSVSTATVRLEQEGRVCVLALASLSAAQPTAADYALPAPDVPSARDVRHQPAPDGAPRIAHRLEVRPCLGGRMFSSSDDAVSGGWLRLAEPEPMTPALLVFLVDAWLPAPWVRLDGPVPAPTLDLTVHLRATDVLADLDPAEPVLARYSSRASAEGFSEEDCEIWAPDGTLLAQGRQLALLRPGSVPWA